MDLQNIIYSCLQSKQIKESISPTYPITQTSIFALTTGPGCTYRNTQTCAQEVEEKRGGRSDCAVGGAFAGSSILARYTIADKIRSNLICGGS